MQKTFKVLILRVTLIGQIGLGFYISYGKGLLTLDIPFLFIGIEKYKKLIGE